MAEIAYLDGAFLPLQEARVPVLDRGYLFADGVYEVIAVYDSSIFTLDAHLARLDASLQGIGLRNPLSHSQWRHVLSELVERNGRGNLMLYLQVTRGVQPARTFTFPADPKPCVLAFCQALPATPETILTRGVSAITLQDTRWLNCHIKSIALLGNTMLANAALRAGCNEAILLRGDQLTEGGSSNVFIVTGGRAATPPKSNLILAGITRDLLLELAREGGIPCDERAVSEAEIRAADEIWISSTTREIYAVTQLDGKPVGGGTPGPIWRRMYDLLQQRKQASS